MILRFVEGVDVFSDLILWQAGDILPIIPSHVECVSQDGKSYIGALLDGGVEARKPGYDTYKKDYIVRLDCSPEMDKLFYDFVESRIGTPYDWEAIVGFALPLDLHLKGHEICSAFMSAALCHCGYFANELAVPFHRISPRDLLFGLSIRTKL